REPDETDARGLYLHDCGGARRETLAEVDRPCPQSSGRHGAGKSAEGSYSRRPLITLISRKMTATTSRMCSTPPSVFFVITPSSHRTMRMTTTAIMCVRPP